MRKPFWKNSLVVRPTKLNIYLPCGLVILLLDFYARKFKRYVIVYKRSGLERRS